MKLLPQSLETDRLLLRPWEGRDVIPFAAMCADPKVMEYFPKTLSEAETVAVVQKFERRRLKHGFSFWAAELKSTREFVGVIGLGVPYYDASFTPCVEVGWRLATPHWGKGLATEGADASLKFGFSELALEEIIAVTAVENQNSRRVMERLGMEYQPGADFDHPNVPVGSRYRKHVLYRIQAGK